MPVDIVLGIALRQSLTRTALRPSRRLATPLADFRRHASLLAAPCPRLNRQRLAISIASPRLTCHCGLRQFSLSSTRWRAAETAKVSTSSSDAGDPPALALYVAPLRTTFRRLKLFSLCSLSLASLLTPVLLFAPGAIDMPARIGLVAIALATSGSSTALIAWIGKPYVGEMRLTRRKTEGTVGGRQEGAPVLEAITTDWRLRSRLTTIYEPSYLRGTSRPFATWELAATPPSSPAISSGSTEEIPSLLVAETKDLRTGKVLGRWWARWRRDAVSLDSASKEAGQWRAEGVCEAEGDVLRYFSVHEDQLDDDWRILG